MEHPSHYDHRLIVDHDDYDTIMKTAKTIEHVRSIDDPLFTHECILCLNSENGLIPYSLLDRRGG